MTLLSVTIDRINRFIDKSKIDFRYSQHAKKPFREYCNVSPLHVVVVGAGISGLATAYELEQSGHTVTILEAASQPGGRASTIREGFSDNLYIDAGGFRFLARHYLIRDYLREFNLPATNFYPIENDLFVYFNGEFIRRSAYQRISRIKLPRRPTVEEQWVFDQEDCHMQRIDGGVSKIIDAFVNKLKTNITCNAEVKEIEQKPSSVIVKYITDGEEKIKNADFVVSAVPIAVFKKIIVKPEMSAAKLEAVKRLSVRPASLIYFEMPTEYWLEQNLNGYGVTDTVGEVWTPGMDKNKKMCITMTYTKDDAAREMLAMSSEERIATTIQRCEKFLPWFNDFVTNKIAYSWDEDRFILGSYSQAYDFTDEQLNLIRQPDGRLHFAGEHAATSWLCWMEGALESAKRVVNEINKIIKG